MAITTNLCLKYKKFILKPSFNRIMQFRTLSPVQRIEHNNWIKQFQTNHNFRSIDPAYKEIPFTSQLFEDMKNPELLNKPEYYLLGTYPIDLRSNDHQKMPTLSQSFSKEESKWQTKHNKLGINHSGIPKISNSFVLEQQPKMNNINPTISFPTSEEHLTKSFELRK